MGGGILRALPEQAQATSRLPPQRHSKITGPRGAFLAWGHTPDHAARGRESQNLREFTAQGLCPFGRTAQADRRTGGPGLGVDGAGAHAKHQNTQDTDMGTDPGRPGENERFCKNHDEMVVLLSVIAPNQGLAEQSTAKPAVNMAPVQDFSGSRVTTLAR